MGQTFTNVFPFFRLLIFQANCDGRTALHLASVEGQQECVEFLIETGGVINAKDRWKRTPLDDAVSQGHLKIAFLLDQAGTVQVTLSFLFLICR